MEWTPKESKESCGVEKDLERRKGPAGDTGCSSATDAKDK